MIISFAQLAVERVVNSLPEGLLIAFCAWLLLRLMGRQNAGTRFAVWLVALAGVVALPLLGGLGSAQSSLIPQAHVQFAVPSFWAISFFVLWLAIALLALARVVAGVWQVRQIRRNCTEIPVNELDPTLVGLLAETNRPVRLLVSDKARVPAALGFRNPAIVLPGWALRDLNAVQLRPILIHELAHLRRRDDWTNLLQKTARAILFFHPAVWWIDARLSLEREMACDDAVLAATGNPRAYAGCLIDLLERGCARRGWTMAQAAVARARDASLRIARILRIGSSATTRVGRAALGVAASLSIACAGVATCMPRLVEFVPVNSISASQIAKPRITDDGIRFPTSALIPASFHPAQEPHLKSALIRKTTAKRNISTHRPVAPQLATVKPAPRNPVVMARFLSVNQAGPMADGPMVIVLETSETTTSLTSAQLRTIGAQQLRQSGEDPALEIQIFQIINPFTGTPIQILRIGLVVAGEAGQIAQSI
jgi:beta-lactamase regulating signal transducer with metallopeptidase domain